MTTQSTSYEGASGSHALEDLLPKLASLSDDAITRPHTDPHAAAVTALLVADWLAQPQVAAHLPLVGLDQTAIRDLSRIARAIVGIVETLGGDYLSDTKQIPVEIASRGQEVRASTIKELEKALPYDRDVTMWLETVRRGSDIVDLVYDLRTLAELLTLHAASMKDSLVKLPAILRATSDAIEYALRADEAPELALARGRLARLWTIFVPAYERAAAAGRVLTREQGAERSFPPLALIAGHRRARRRSQSIPPASRPEAAPRRLQQSGDDEMQKETTTNDAVRVDKPKDQESRKLESGRHGRETGSRRAHRAVLELEVGIESESNFYVGFTENVSSAGVFVATYLVKPIGSKMDIALTMPDGQTMRIPGIVRWQRAASEDGWPGMGVCFEKVSEEQEARIQRFLALREPMFYVD